MCEESIYEPETLEIEHTCNNCGYEFLTNYSTPPCEKCGSEDIEVRRIIG